MERRREREAREAEQQAATQRQNREERLFEEKLQARYEERLNHYRLTRGPGAPKEVFDKEVWPKLRQQYAAGGGRGRSRAAGVVSLRLLVNLEGCRLRGRHTSPGEKFARSAFPSLLGPGPPIPLNGEFNCPSCRGPAARGLPRAGGEEAARVVYTPNPNHAATRRHSAPLAR